MSNSEPTWQTTVYAIVAHPTEPSLLLLPSADGWCLPCARIAARIWSPEVEQVNRALCETLGSDCTILRCAATKVDREARQSEILYVVELHSPLSVSPAGGSWIGPERLADLPLAIPEQRTALAEYFAEYTNPGNAELRPPWAKPGWFATATAWMADQLAQHGYSLVAPIEQLKSWGISCILRSRTATDDIYFKVASRRPLFADEPRLMEALAALHPNLIPAPLAIDAERGWMLLANVGPQLRGNPDKAAWETALRLHAQLQRSFVGQEATLSAIGCLDRRLERLASQIDLLNQPLPGLDAAELEQLRGLVPRLQAMCSQLAAMPVPHTLLHGDLHGGNIALHNDRYLLFDWTDGSIAHPFFDLVTLLDEAPATLDQQACRDLRDAYLLMWADYAPIEDLLAAWRLAEPLGAFHQIVSYYHIVESLEPASKHELTIGIKYWVQRMVQSMA